MSVRVQFVLSDEEYEDLKKKVKEEGVSISKYVKDKVLPQENSFEALWSEFQTKLALFPTEVEFNVATLLGHDRWKQLDRSSKLSLAKLFNRKVTLGECTSVICVGRSPSNVSIYKKNNGS